MIDVEMLRPTADEMLSGFSAGQAMKQRIMLSASGVERLPQIATEMLSGLQATPALRHRILVQAERSARAEPRVQAKTPHRRVSLARFTPIAGMAFVMVLMIGLGLNYGMDPVAPQLAPSAAPVVSVDLGSGMAGSGVGDSAAPQYRSLFVGEGANPPLIGINGRFYRMLSVPVSTGVIGAPIAEVQENTEEPSLAATVGVVSNIVNAGTQVYAVDGISSKTACIAEVDGTLRLFQRVGYASATFIGNEMFEDTLDVNGRVSALELSGVGVITNERHANELIYTLNEFATYGGSDMPNSGQALTIYLSNGLSLQLTVQDDTLGGCGAWVCPEFFEAFDEYLQMA